MKSAYKSPAGNNFDMRYRVSSNIQNRNSAKSENFSKIYYTMPTSFAGAMSNSMGHQSRLWSAGYNSDHPSSADLLLGSTHIANDKSTFNALRGLLYGDGGDSSQSPLPSGSGSGSSYAGSSPFNYSEWSPAAKMFGMDRSTAYEEHLANTAHQREVADLKAAGLNPVLGLSSGAPTVSGSYVGGSGYGSSAKKTSFKNIADVIGSIAGMIVLAKSKNKYAGSWTASMTSKAFSQAGKLLDDVLE